MNSITTHVLDVSQGRPAAGVAVRLERFDNRGTPKFIAQSETNADGRCPNLVPANTKLEGGTYRLRFETQDYFRKQHVATFYPFVEVTFTIADPMQHHHVPLLLSPFGYSTYRGS